MKKEIKLIISILKAAPQIKQRVFSTLWVIFFGTVSDICSSGYSLGCGIMIMTGALLFYQCILQVSCTGIAQSSATAKKLQTVFTFYVLIPSNIIIFMLLSAYRVYLAYKPPHNMSLSQNYTLQCESILILSLMFFFTMLSEIILNKFYVIGCAIIVLSVVPLIFWRNFSIFISPHLTSLTLTTSIIAGFMIIIAGSLLSILMANLLYKYPQSAFLMKAATKVKA